MAKLAVRPLHDRVLIKRIEEGETMHGSLYIPDAAKEKPQRGEVVAIGTGKRTENGKHWPPGVEVGDHILFGKYAGADIKLDGEDFLILREDEILGVLTAESPLDPSRETSPPR